MHQSYAETTPENTPNPTFCELVMKAAWACAASGEEFAEAQLKSALVAEWGVTPQLAEGWMSGVNALANYMLSEAVGDALDEEGRAVEASRKATRPLLEARFQSRLDRLDDELRGAVYCGVAGCGAKCPSRGHQERTRLSKLGPVTTSRRWSRCAQHGGFSAGDQALLLPAGDFTAELEEAATLLATVGTFGAAEKLLSSLLGLDVSAHAIQQMTHDRGRYVGRANDKEADTYAPFELSGLEKKERARPPTKARPPRLAYIEVDGVVPMTRALDPARSSRVEGARGGKGRRYKLVGREVKNAVLYDGEDCAQIMDSRGCVLQKTYVSRLGNWVPFALTLWVAVLRLRFDQAERLVLLSDGADWIRRLADWMPCTVCLILDLFHAKKRIWELAAALWEDDDQRKRWARLQCERVEDGRVCAVLETLERLRRKRSRVPACLDELHTYFTNNQDRMNYAEYKREGLRISTANVESANYHLTGDRLKKQGMRWSEQGAANMSVLRADLFNDQWRQRTREYIRAAA